MKKKMLLAFSPVNSRFCFLFFSFFLITVGVYAQTVTGTVTDNENKPVSGATVSVKGTTKATATNAAGSFSINAAGNDTIVVSYVGFVTMEVPVNGRNDISVSMISSDGTDLDVVVVTALGIRKSSKNWAIPQHLLIQMNWLRTGLPTLWNLLKAR